MEIFRVEQAQQLRRDGSGNNTAGSAPSSPRIRPARKLKASAAKQFWLKQLHAWHWVSAAIALTAMFGFSITGITLNHAASIAAKPHVITRAAALPKSSLGLLARHAAEGALPEAVAKEVNALVAIDARGVAAEWSAEEIYVAVPGPGSDAWVSIDRASGKIESERTDRGWISFFNDLHKGRNTGTAWFWFIDVFAVACVIFTLTGLLLLQLHARRRPATWPLVTLGTVLPIILVLFFLHT